MAERYKRYWFTSEDQLAIVEEKNATIEKNYTTTNFGSIGTSDLEIRLHTVNLDNANFGAGDMETTSPGTPIQFHEALVFKVISQGYEDPRNQNLQASQYFQGKYDQRVRDAKKYAKRGFQRDAHIRPVDF